MHETRFRKIMFGEPTYPVSTLQKIMLATVFALGTQREHKIDKQHEIDMPNVNPTRMLAKGRIFHQLTLGFALGWLGSMLGPRGLISNWWNIGFFSRWRIKLRMK